MSLEELRAQAEQEEAEQETEETEQPEPEESEVEETEQESEFQETEQLEDLELELDGEPEPDQQKPSAEEALVHKLTKQRKKRQEVESENETLRQRLEKLESQLQGNSQPAAPQTPPQGNVAEPKMPDMYDPGIDGDRDKYDAAVKKFWHDYQAFQNRHQQAERQQEQYREQVQQRTKALAERAAKFSRDHNVNVDRVAEALDKATSEIDRATKIDGSLATLLDSVGDGSERVAYYIGTNDSAMSRVKQLLEEDPNGFKAIAYMTRTAEKLRPKHSKQVSKAPEPDEPIKGDSSKGSAAASKVQAMWDKADTPEKMMEARRKARELGVKLDT